VRIQTQLGKFAIGVGVVTLLGILGSIVTVQGAGGNTSPTQVTVVNPTVPVSAPSPLPVSASTPLPVSASSPIPVSAPSALPVTASTPLPVNLSNTAATPLYTRDADYATKRPFAMFKSGNFVSAGGLYSSGEYSEFLFRQHSREHVSAPRAQRSVLLYARRSEWTASYRRRHPRVCESESDRIPDRCACAVGGALG
jgi:hypothetical protein